jgi:uncharacterized protein YbjT (DUF2867 family)
VVLRSSFYMTNLLAAAEQVRRDGVLIAPAGTGRIAMIDPYNVGEVAATVLTGDGRAGRTYDLTGPEAIGYERVARELSDAVGAPVRYIDAPEEAVRAGLAASGMPDWLVQHLVGVFRVVRCGAMGDVTDTVRTLTGHAPRTFADFARRHAEAFRARQSEPVAAP